MKLLMHFQTRHVQTYGVPAELVMGRDLKILKRVKVLFEEAEQLEELYAFLDLCFSSNPTQPIGTPYILKIANRRFGYIKGKKKEATKPVTTEVATWIETERQKRNRPT